MTALMTGGGNGYRLGGRYWPELPRRSARGCASAPTELSPQMKITLAAGATCAARYDGALYAKAQNLRAVARAAYDRALADVDVLLMPTTPGPPHPIDADLPLASACMRGWAVLEHVSDRHDRPSRVSDAGAPRPTAYRSA